METDFEAKVEAEFNKMIDSVAAQPVATENSHAEEDFHR